MIKLDNKFDNFKNAVKRLNEANTAYKSMKSNELYQDALIMRFEFTFELAWKCLREFMLAQGYLKDGLNSPKVVLTKAYGESIISDESAWLSMLNDRNLMAHTYDNAIALRIAEDISNRYAKTLAALVKTIQSNI